MASDLRAARYFRDGDTDEARALIQNLMDALLNHGIPKYSVLNTRYGAAVVISKAEFRTFKNTNLNRRRFGDYILRFAYLPNTPQYVAQFWVDTLYEAHKASKPSPGQA